MFSNLKDISKAANQIAEEKGISSEKVWEAIEWALAAAYKKEYGQKGEVIKAKFNPESNTLNFWQVKTVVSNETVRFPKEGENVSGEKEEKEKNNETTIENVENKLPLFNEAKHILIADAKKIKPDAQVGDEIIFPLEVHDDFGRIASQAAKQAILQKLRELEKESIIEEFKGREGQVVSGIIQRFDRGNVYVNLGRATGVMFANESVPGERYVSGSRMRFLILTVQNVPRLPEIILSRANPNFIAKLFEMEVPELAEGLIEIKAIAREAGSRTKVAVYSKTAGIDAVGSLVGQRGTRIMAVNNELGQEKIDVIEWSDDVEKLIANSLSPAKVESVEILPRHEARVNLAEDQLSLAIGKNGQNVRLAAKLTGYKIDIRSLTNPEKVQFKSGTGDEEEYSSAEEDNIEVVSENKEKKVENN
jgi:N utilization substance protein A